MKQYIKSKPIKWGFKFWFRCCSTTGYLYQLDIYQGKKANLDLGLGESVVLQLTEMLNGMYITIYADNFFTSPLLVHKLHNNGLYMVGTVKKNRRSMPKCMKVNSHY